MPRSKLYCGYPRIKYILLFSFQPQCYLIPLWCHNVHRFGNGLKYDMNSLIHLFYFLFYEIKICVGSRNIGTVLYDSGHSRKAKAAAINACSEEYSALGAITMTISCSEAEGVKHRLPNSKASIEKKSYCGKPRRKGEGRTTPRQSDRMNNGRRPCPLRQRPLRASRAEAFPLPKVQGASPATERHSIPKQGRSYAAAWRQAAA